MAYLIFKDLATFNSITKEIANTPFDGVQLFASKSELDYGYDGVDNIIGHSISTDGRVCIGHHFSVEDEAWLEVYLSDDVTSGNVIFSEVFPENW